jgi:hypothetical protein
MKLCKDCRYYGGGRECHHPSVAGVDVVTGRGFSAYCSTARLGHEPCKPQALLFEPKLTLIQKIKGLLVKEGA